MKIARRLLSLLLALLMIFALAACGGNEGTTDKPSGDQGGENPVGGSDEVSGGNDDKNEFVMPDRPVDETSGMEYVIIQANPIENPFGFSQDEKVGLQVADRIAEIKELYDCTFEFRQIGDGALLQQMQAAQFVDKGGDLLFYEKGSYLRKCIGVGGSDSLMQDLLALDNIINFWNAEKWGPIAAREAMMAGGSFYGVSPALWVDCTPLPYYQVVYNKTIIENAGATDPQEYWENEEWDRYAMLDVITSTTDTASGIWGMTACADHMIRATFLATGLQLASIDKINADGTVEWSNNVKSPEAIEALEWLKTTLTANAKCFNNGVYNFNSWATYTPFNEGLCTMAVTRPIDLFNYVVVESGNPFGVTTWAGEEANILTGYYEHVCSIAIPIFAQDIEHSAFIMADMFEGLGDVETYEDVLAFYSETYFDSELDVTMMVRPGATLQYSYWVNDGMDKIWTTFRDNMMIMSSVRSLIDKYAGTIDTAVETHIVPNKVVLDEWSTKVNFD